MDRRGICTLGNLIVDLLYRAGHYPARGELAQIHGPRGMSVGGLACNVSLSLARLDPDLPVFVCGVLGQDREGAFIRARFGEHPGIDTSRLIRGEETAYTLVINDQESRERTFFTSCGSGDLLDDSSLDLAALPARILHAGYILLNAGLDRPDPEHGTRLARLLMEARRLGIQTSVDVVTQRGGRYKELVPPALRHSDYVIINELEAQQITGVVLREPGGRLLRDQLPRTLSALMGMGVHRWAIIHSPEGAWGMGHEGVAQGLPSLQLPPARIQGTTGAGDAFAAGVLHAAHEGAGLLEALRLGTATAARSLLERDSYSGILPLEQTLAFYHGLGGN
ncbi:MAG: carbohydrate kinase family protein [Clostridiales bacterium]|nr:carbohydrate kinase family protein [Clostridiales bacterium]